MCEKSLYEFTCLCGRRYETAEAAAMACAIVLACAAVKLLHHFVSTHGLARLQRWRQI